MDTLAGREHETPPFDRYMPHRGRPGLALVDRRGAVELLSEASRILQIQMLDHVIVGTSAPGRSGYFSFKESGLLA
jgi:RadC-like JAB domain